MTTTKTKPKPAKIACDQCGKPFQPAKPWARFCSTACRNINHQRDRYADSKKAARALAFVVDQLTAAGIADVGVAANPHVVAALKRARNVVGT